MNLTLAYRGHSEIEQSAQRQVFHLVPNLARDPVGLDAPLLKPLRFREAMSALHDVVISDLRFKKRDKTAYENWKKDEQARAASVRHHAYQAAMQEMQLRGTRRHSGIAIQLRKASQALLERANEVFGLSLPPRSCAVAPASSMRSSHNGCGRCRFF